MESESSHLDKYSSSWSLKKYDRFFGEDEEEIRGFADNALLDAEKAYCQILRIADNGHPNTPERTSELRRFAVDVATRELGLTEEQSWKVGVLIGELVQNAFRYAEDGPESLDFIRIGSESPELGISVFNEINKPSTFIEYDGDILAGDLDGIDLGELLNTLETHGFGTPILQEMTGSRYDRFEFDGIGPLGEEKRKMAAYVIFDCSRKPTDDSMGVAA